MVIKDFTAKMGFHLLCQVSKEDCDIQDKETMLFAGTAISNGSCVGIVNSIGMNTEIGKIQQQIQDAAEEEEDSPLKKKIDHFGERLAQVFPLLSISLPDLFLLVIFPA